jgi:hypothetical protein
VQIVSKKIYLSHTSDFNMMFCEWADAELENMKGREKVSGISN